MTMSRSLAPKPPPVTLTGEPGSPRSGLILSVGMTVRTSSLAFPEVVNGPDARRAYEADGREGTRKEALQEPFRSAETPEATGVWSRVTLIPFSLAAKPAPATVMDSAGPPRAALRKRAGVTRYGIFCWPAGLEMSME